MTRYENKAKRVKVNCASFCWKTASSLELELMASSLPSLEKSRPILPWTISQVPDRWSSSLGCVQAFPFHRLDSSSPRAGGLGWLSCWCRTVAGSETHVEETDGAAEHSSSRPASVRSAHCGHGVSAPVLSAVHVARRHFQYEVSFSVLTSELALL